MAYNTSEKLGSHCFSSCLAEKLECQLTSCLVDHHNMRDCVTQSMPSNSETSWKVRTMQYGTTASKRCSTRRSIMISKSLEIHTQKVLWCGYTTPWFHLDNLVPPAMDWTFQIGTTKRTYRIQGTTGRKKRLVVHIDRLKLYCQCQDPHPDTELADTLPSHQPASDSESTTSNFGDQLQIVDDDQDTVLVERTQVPSCQQRPPKRLLDNVEH